MKNNPPSALPRRSWLRFGPGLLLALTALAWSWPHLFPQTKPPQIQSAPIVAAPPSAPDPTWILGQRTALKMSDAQFQKLTQLEARWRRDTRALQSDLDAATQSFNRQMKASAAQKTGATLEELQTRAAPVTELSRQLAGARRAWWDEASLVLNQAQREKARAAWSRHLAGRLAPTHGNQAN